MKRRGKTKLNKRGVTIAEAVVAMAVIIAVSAAAITCIEAFSKTSANMNGKNEALIIAENALEVFKGTDDYSDYRRIRRDFVQTNPTVSDVPVDEKYPDVVVENYEVSGCTVEIDLRYDSVTGRAFFSAVVKDAKKHTVLNIDSYEKVITVKEGG